MPKHAPPPKPKTPPHILPKDLLPPRLGPRPLPLHLTMALCVWLNLPTGWQRWKNGLNDSKLALNPQKNAALQKILSHPATQDPEFESCLAAEALRRTRAFIAGVQRYQQSPIRRDRLDAPVIAQLGNTKLRDYNIDAPNAPMVFVIPSLINRYDILDLDHDHSFLESVAKAGFRPLLVDWGKPGDEENHFTIGDYVTKRLVQLLTPFAHKPVHLMGYCMGGLLAMALATLRPAMTKTLSLLATPWDFHKPDASIGTLLAKMVDEHRQHLAFDSPLAVDALQAFFASLQPMQALKKFSNFATLDDAAEERRFVLLEDWLNDGVPLAAPAARECVEDWYGANLPARGLWHVGDTPILPAKITVPTYCLVPGKDHIVPPESALALAKALPHHTLHEPIIGHIGMMASVRALHQVWIPYLRWLAEHA